MPQEKAAVTIGDSILDLVTAGMYDHPLAIYREYVQNAVDALASQCEDGQGHVEITLDRHRRSLRIRDNGPGLSAEECVQELVPIGQSNKRFGVDRGFRGIGRLAGLAFAERVVFRSRRNADQPVSRITWTRARTLRRDQWPDRAQQTLERCVTVETEDEPGYPDHFFEAEVLDISRHAAGSLLNEDAVRRYLAETCPAPMRTDFPHAEQIERILGPEHRPAWQRITVQQSPEAIHRQHGPAIRFSDQRAEPYGDLEEFRAPRLDGEGDSAVGWVAHWAYGGTIPRSAGVRGIRARVGNIQIGGESVFDHLFEEDRLNRWCVGEIHVVDPMILPNARRDYFEPGPHLRHLENHLASLFRALSGRCRQASADRNRTKRLQATTATIQEAHRLARTGLLSDADAALLIQEARLQEAAARERMIKAGASPDELEELDRAHENLDEAEAARRPDPYAGLHPRAAEAYRRTAAEMARSLASPGQAQRIMERILGAAEQRAA